MDTIVGIDMSFTHTALARLVRGNVPLLSAVLTDPLPHSATEDQRYQRMCHIRDAVVPLAAGADLVVMESTYAGPHASSRDLTALWYVAYGGLRASGVHVATCRPATLKRWATGSGRAGKVAVAVAMARRWPDVGLAGDDETDALALASIGAHRAGWLPWPPTVYQTESLAALTWPGAA